MNSAENKRIYIRMGVGGILGAVTTGVLGYSWAAWNNNLNPVAGLGLVVLITIGMALGMFLGIFKRSKSKRENTNQ